MLIKTVEFKKEQTGKWEEGYFIMTEENSIFLDAELKPVGDSEGKIWDYRDSYKMELKFPFELPVVACEYKEDNNAYNVPTSSLDNEYDENDDTDCACAIWTRKEAVENICHKDALDAINSIF